jgi:predicted ATPase
MKTLNRVALKNFLSFSDVDVELAELSVLVGPNGAGKTNFLRAFQFIGQMARTDLGPAVMAFGGPENIKFRGGKRRTGRVSIEFEGVMTKNASAKATDTYKIQFRTNRLPRKGDTKGEATGPIFFERTESFFFKRTKGRGRRITLEGTELKLDHLSGSEPTSRTSTTKEMAVQKSASGLSLLRRLGSEYEAPQVEELARIFEELRVYEVDVESVRQPSEDENPEQLASDGSNVATYLLWLRDNHPDRYETVESDVRFVLPGFRGFEFTTLGGSDKAIRLDIKEEHLTGSTPLARASFGTIRSIALFTMLQDPNPPRLTCLEEVDHGLHPNALDRLVLRLRQASERTQILVATHSPALVNRLSPEELIVFERDESTGATRVPDITVEDVEEMQAVSGLRLGELWFSGLIGSDQ